MVCVEGMCNPPNGVAEESLNLMQQDNSLFIMVEDNRKDVNWERVSF
jgi:hypothetical protein